jgi:hypothetical protein
LGVTGATAPGDHDMATKSKEGDSPGTGIGNAAGAGPARKASQEATGQGVSKERGPATRSKKQPGKRPKQGGS